MTGAQFRRWREKMSLTVDELAADLELSRATVYRYELDVVLPRWLVFALRGLETERGNEQTNRSR